MANEYSPQPNGGSPLVLAIDSGSSATSVALGNGDRVLAERVLEGSRSSEGLLRAIDEVLRQEGLVAGDLERLLALQGPGSFTGLRVGLATLFALHQVLNVPATAVPTFDALALSTTGRGRCVAAVDALRGEWFAQVYQVDGEPVGAPAILTPQQMAELSPCTVVGFGVERLADTAEWPADAHLQEPRELATTALRLARRADLVWDPGQLTRPLYLRPPAAKKQSVKRTG